MPYEEWLRKMEADLEKQGYKIYELLTKQDMANISEGDPWPFQIIPLAALRPETWGPLRPNPGGTIERNTNTFQDHYDSVSPLDSRIQNVYTTTQAAYGHWIVDHGMLISPTPANTTATNFGLKRVTGALTSGSAAIILFSPGATKKPTTWWCILGNDNATNPHTTYYDCQFITDTSSVLLNRIQIRGIDMGMCKIPLFYDHTTAGEDILLNIDDNSGSSSTNIYSTLLAGEHS